MVFIYVLKEHLSLVGHALYLERLALGRWCISLLILLVHSLLFLGGVLDNLENQDLIRLYERVQEQLKVDELLSILLPMLLLYYIAFDIEKSADLV